MRKSIAAAVIAAVLLPAPIGRLMHRAREAKKIGVLIGVPESSPPSAVQNASTTIAPAAVASQGGNAAVPSANQPPLNAATASNPPQVASPDLHQTQTANAQSQVIGPNAQPQATAPSASEATSPAAIAENSSEGETKSAAEATTEAQPSTASQSSSHAKKKTVASASQRRVGSARARMVGITSDGRLIYRTPSGRTTIIAPDSGEDEFIPRRHRRMFIERDEMRAPPPQFEPDYFPYD